MKAGSPENLKIIFDKRMADNETINAGAIVQALLNSGIKNLPTSIQISNYVCNSCMPEPIQNPGWVLAYYSF